MTNSRGGHAVGTVHSEGYDAVRTGHIGRAYYGGVGTVYIVGGAHSVGTVDTVGSNSDRAYNEE